MRNYITQFYQIIKYYFAILQLHINLPEIKKELSLLSLLRGNLIMQNENLKTMRVMITKQRLNDIRSVCTEKQMSSFGSFLETLSIPSHLKKNHSLLSQIPQYQQIKLEYSHIQNALSLILPEIDATQKRINSTVQYHYANAERFLTILAEYKKGYISFTQCKTLLTSEYKASYEFLYPNMELQPKLIQDFVSTYHYFPYRITLWNKYFVENEFTRLHLFWASFKKFPPDEQQRKVVVTDTDNCLVVAGAGSGKSATIGAKVKYLVEQKGIDLSEILLLSFTNASARDLKKGILKNTGLQVKARTFHSLGLEIIRSKQPGIKPVEDKYLLTIIADFFRAHIYENVQTIQHFIEYFSCYITLTRPIDQFKSLGEYHEHYKRVDFETLKSKYEREQFKQEQQKTLEEKRVSYKGEKVTTIEEFMIANYLFTNGIRYQYNYAPTDYKQSTSRKGEELKFPFYLPDYKIYIEFSQIDENEQLPITSSIEEAKLVRILKERRKYCYDNKLNFIELHSFMSKDDSLLNILQSELVSLGIEFEPIDFKELYSAIYDQNNKEYFKKFQEFIASFVNLFKGNGYTETDFDLFLLKNEEETTNIFQKIRNRLFFSLVKPIYTYYQRKLEEINQIDFNDMINSATNMVKKGQYSLSYKYIIVDEYQDISQVRSQLIQAIKQQTNAKLMCVGDDWQSIYRFAGSDLSLFKENFKQNYGHYRLLKIEKTYRNSQQLIDIAGKFIKENKKQLDKTLLSATLHPKPFPIRLLEYSDNSISEIFQKALDAIIYSFGVNSSIAILGRNQADAQQLIHPELFTVKTIKTNGKKITQVISHKYNDLIIPYFTVHQSKGLEADNVILINATNRINGFPNQMTDDPLLGWILTKSSNNYPFAEERRLFYVALTRTKNITYILVPQTDKSVFIRELVDSYNLKIETSAENEEQLKLCPKCKTGVLKELHNKTVRCLNHPGCDFNLSTKYLESFRKDVRCPSCGDYLVVRPGNYGKPFYGCRNYPDCKTMIAISQSRVATSHNNDYDR